MKRILIINPFGIGDVLFTTPLIRAIREEHPEAIVDYWCNERVKGILKNNKNINKIFSLSRGDIKKIYNRSKLEGIYKSVKLVSAIKKGKFDISFDFSLDHRYGFISKICGIKRRIGFNYKNRGRFLTDKKDIDGYDQKHVVEYYLDLLQFVGVSCRSRNLDLSVLSIDKIKSRNILRGLGINDGDLVVGIFPGAGASWGKEAILKHWPAEKFGALVDRINKDFGAKILILGDASERPIADIIIKTAHYKAIDLVGKTTLEELIAIINNVDILITNDGGPLHIAVALGKKTVSFFGPVDPKVYGPYPPSDSHHIVLRMALECSPCYSQFRLSTCRRDRECLRSIDVAQALAAVSTLLSGRGE